MGKRANLPVACLPLLAALTPDRAHRHPDRRERRGDRLRALRRRRHRRRDRHERPAVPDEGDPRRAEARAASSPSSAARWVTVQEDYFGGLADVIFIGEAEETWPRFLARVGRRGGTSSATSRPRRPT